MKFQTEFFSNENIYISPCIIYIYFIPIYNGYFLSMSCLDIASIFYHVTDIRNLMKYLVFLHVDL